jgi:hypothetical protein
LVSSRLIARLDLCSSHCHGWLVLPSLYARAAFCFPRCGAFWKVLEKCHCKQGQSAWNVGEMSVCFLVPVVPNERVWV